MGVLRGVVPDDVVYIVLKVIPGNNRLWRAGIRRVRGSSTFDSVNVAKRRRSSRKSDSLRAAKKKNALFMYKNSIRNCEVLYDNIIKLY